MREDQHYKFQFVSGSTLKILALVTMIIDHIGASFLESLIIAWNDGIAPRSALYKAPFLFFDWMSDYGTLWNVYWTMRLIGRLAFPIYCFLLVEGFRHTHNRKNYAIRLGIFAVVSEIPFNLAFFGGPFFWDHQNVFWNLLLSFLTMWMWDWITTNHPKQAKKAAEERAFKESMPEWVEVVDSVEPAATEPAPGSNHRVAWIFAGILATVFICILAQVTNTDYGALGVACTLALYALRKRQLIQAPVGAFCFYMSESFWTVPCAFIPVLLYNGKRGLKLKFFFYVMYPLHLLLLGLLRVYLGI